MEHISPYLPGIILAHTAFLISIASPGPNILAVIGTSMSIGRSSGIALALGVASGSFVWAAFTVLGLSALLSAYASALIAIKIIGGIFLCWLAFKSFKSAYSSHDIEIKELAGGKRTLLNYILRGLTIQLTNPKAALAWIAIISLGLKPDAPIWVGVVIMFGTFSLSVAIHILYAIAFSTSTMVRIYSKARRYIQLSLGAFFTFAGAKLLLDRN